MKAYRVVQRAPAVQEYQRRIGVGFDLLLPEINALALMIGELRDAGITDMSKKEDEYCVRTERNLLDAIIQARGRTGGDTEVPRR